jgi:hypothetical protein
MAEAVARRSPVPSNAMAYRAFAHADYIDAYTIRLPSSDDGMPERFVRAMFESPPGWVSALADLRDRIVSVFGLKKASDLIRHGLSSADGKPAESGKAHVNLSVLKRAGNEVFIGENDRHLDFRISVLGSPIDSGTEICVVTSVKLNNFLGRLYLLPVKPMHRLIVPAMMRRAARTVALAH